MALPPQAAGSRGPPPFFLPSMTVDPPCVRFKPATAPKYVAILPGSSEGIGGSMAAARTSPERRKAPRLTVEKIAYLNLEEDNGGIILNVSEGGLCFHSIIPLHSSDIVRFWLSYRGESIEGEGQLVWTDDSQKRSGLCFVNTSTEARDKLFDLIREPAPPVVRGSVARSRNLGREPGSLTIRGPLARAVRSFRGFSGGLALGLLISALIAGAYISHRQLGEALVGLGEHLGATRVAGQPNVKTPTEATAPLQKQVVVSTTYGRNQRTPSERGQVMPQRSNRPLAMPRVAVAAKPQRQEVGRNTTAEMKLAASDTPPAKLAVPAGNAANLSPPSLLFSPNPLTAASPAIVPGMSKPLLPPRPPEKGRVVEAESSGTGGVPEIQQMYFEIGKFKQRFSANEEAERLAKLGFPSSIVQKGWLWIDSYRVLVGPYHENTEAESAHRKLVTNGFEARPFERGSRNFVLPARLIWHGRDVPEGDCVIKWESYVGDVRIKFEQDNRVIASAEAKWVAREPKYERSAIAYVNRADGLRTLVELQFEGMSRTLIFK